MDDDMTEPAGPRRLGERLDGVHARLDRIAELEAGIRGLQAEQVREVVRYLDERQRLDVDMVGRPHPAQQRCMVAEVAIAKGVSAITAQTFMSDAYLLVTNTPRVLQAVADGKLALSPARDVAVETALIDDEALRLLADEVIAEEAVDLLPGRVRLVAQRRVMQIDPDAAARRSVKERADKHVRLLPTGDDCAHLDAYLPVEQAAACMTALHDHAVAQRAVGDARTVSHLMCDTLVERVTGASHAEEVKATISLVMSDSTLVGLDDAPAHVVGAGPLTAHVARMVATTGNAWLQRVFTDPVDGSISHLETRRRLVDAGLRRLVVAADQHCRGIHCASKIRDIDHIREYANGGPTTFRNTQGLSKGCHISRDHPHMRVSADPQSRATTWTTPSGLVHVSLPPPALGCGALTRHQVRIRHWIAHPPSSPLERHVVRILVEDARGGPGPAQLQRVDDTDP